MYKYGFSVICATALLASCAVPDGTRYAVVNTTHTSPACTLSQDWCVSNHTYATIAPTNFVKDEVLLVYDSKTDDQQADKILKQYQLRTKSFTELSSVKLKMVTAKTNGKDPLKLTKAINTDQADVKAQTNTYYKSTATTATANERTEYPFVLTQVDAAYPYRGKGVKIGMVDSAIDVFHNSFNSNNITLARLAGGDTPDSTRHGTEIAGVMVSSDPRVGIAPDANLFAVSAFGSAGSKGTADTIAQAIDLCIRQGVDILNLSFAGGKNDAVESVVRKALNQGIIVVASAGNEGPGAEPAYPAAISGVIGVTAIDSRENLFPRANRGDYIDLAAPGVNILTTAPKNSYQLATGTSIATAHVSGLIAVLLSTTGKANFSPDLLNRNAIDLGASGRDIDYGYGLVNLSNILGKNRSR